MTKIRMLTLMAGPNGVARVGDEIEVEDDTALALIAANSAELAEPPAEKPEPKKPAGGKK